MPALFVMTLFASMPLSQMANAQNNAPKSSSSRSVAPNAALTKALSDAAQGAILKNSDSGEMLAFVHGKATAMGRRQQKMYGAVAVEQELSEVTESTSIAYALITMNAHSKVKLFNDADDITNLDDISVGFNTELASGNVNAKAIMKSFNLTQVQYDKIFAAITSLTSGRAGKLTTISPREYSLIKSVLRLLINEDGKTIVDQLSATSDAE